MRIVYLRVLDRLFRWCFEHVPFFADYTLEFVSQLNRKVHGKMMRDDYIGKLRERYYEVK